MLVFPWRNIAYPGGSYGVGDPQKEARMILWFFALVLVYHILMVITGGYEIVTFTYEKADVEVTVVDDI